MAARTLFLPFAILTFVGKHQIYGLDCLKKAGGDKTRVFTGTGTTNCIFIGLGNDMKYTDWTAIETSCGYTARDRLDGYALRLAVLSYADADEVLKFFHGYKGPGFSYFLGITATRTLPYIDASHSQTLEMRKYFSWDDGGEIDDKLWYDNQPNNIVYEESEDVVVLLKNDKMHDYSMKVTGVPTCEYYPYKDQAIQRIPACDGAPSELNRPCRQIFNFRNASLDEAQRICAHAHPVQADHVETGDEYRITCQYEAFTKCEPGERLIFNNCYKFVAKKETKKNAAEECARTANSRLPYITGKSHAKFISEYAQLMEIDSVWIDLNRDGTREVNGRKKSGFNRWNPDQLAFDTMTCQDPQTYDEFYKQATADAAVLLRTTDYQNTLRGFFERTDKSFVSSYVCERQVAETVGRYQIWAWNILTKVHEYHSVVEKWCSLVREMFHYETVYSFDNCYVRTANFYQRSFDMKKGGWDKCKMLHEEPNNKLIARNAILYHYQQASALRVLSQEPLLIGALRKFQAPRASSCCVAKDQKMKTCMEEENRKKFQLMDPMRNSELELPALWHAKHPENQCSDFPSGAVGVAFFNGKINDASALQPMRVLCEYGTRVGAPPAPRRP